MPVHTLSSAHTLKTDTLFNTQPTHAHNPAVHNIEHADHHQASWVPRL